MTSQKTNTAPADLVQSAAELGRQTEQAAPAAPYELTADTSVVVRTVRTDERIETVDLERLLATPRRERGLVVVHEPADFAAYVHRLENPATTVWADDTALSVTAVFNDHTPDSAGWRDHTAVLQVRRDPDWQAWLARDGQLDGQAEFAEHLEDQARVIVDPDAATMLEVATSFHARRNASFSRASRLDTGDVQLAWNEETTASAGASGRLEVPRQFTLLLSPFIGVAPVEVVARLRYRLRDGRLGIGYKLDRPDLAERAAFVDIRASIANTITSPVVSGTAPRPVAVR
jgi:uncharacterized protein YfdQ (DUF2303 family)